MNDAENFAARWSRRKREATKTKPAHTDAPSNNKSLGGEAAGDAKDAKDAPASKTTDAEKQPPFDPATLPPIESIVAGSDIRAFLQSGVPAELAKAALRRAWTTDPAIRDFIEMAENQWDFTNPTSIPGFGPLLPGDDPRQLVSHAMGKLAEATESEPTSPAAAPPKSEPAAASPSRDSQVPGMPEGSAGTVEACLPVEADTPGEFAASQHVDPSASYGRSNRRGHGGALPKEIEEA